MNIYIDCRDKTFGVVEPADMGSRTVIEQVIPATLPLSVVLSLLNAQRVQSEQGVEVVYKVTINQ